VKQILKEKVDGVSTDGPVTLVKNY